MATKLEKTVVKKFVDALLNNSSLEDFDSAEITSLQALCKEFDYDLNSHIDDYTINLRIDASFDIKALSEEAAGSINIDDSNITVTITIDSKKHKLEIDDVGLSYVEMA